MATFSSDGFLPSTSEYTKRKADIKVATPDIIIQEDVISSDTMADAFFAEIGGTEILSSARSMTIDSPLHQGSALIVDSGAGLQVDRTEQTSLPEDIDVTLDVSKYFPIDSSNLASYVDSSLIPYNGELAEVSDANKTVLPGYVEIYLNNLPDKYSVEVEIVNSISNDNGIIITGEG